MHLRSTIQRIEDLRGLRATVMGLGLNGGGLASARFLSEHGATVTVTDMKDESSLADSLSALEGLPIRYVLGRHELADFSNADLVIKNPAVRTDSPYLLSSKSIETDISLFLRFSQSPIIAVTGSKGKSSVSSAIHHILVSSGQDAFLGGNITVSPLSFLDKCNSATPVVLELSSWQLADLRGLKILKPKIAVITSIMPDHMNRYASMEEYVADKRLTYSDQDQECYTVCNRDDSWGRSFASETNGKVYWYSNEPLGMLPGAWIDSSKECRGYFSSTGIDRDLEMILPSKLLVPGLHQRKNMLSAALVCRIFGISAESIVSALATFNGVEHRLECFARKDGVSWYNDSASTVPQAVEAALNSFTSPVILITGGTDKNIDFESTRSMYLKAKKILLLAGTGTEKILPILMKEDIPFLGPYNDLNIAISYAAHYSQPGDNIVLSPGCASFGMFINEFDRGRKFKEFVNIFLGLVR
jgi:UDP-N-acetylmuramoylalanine--D-glutamate ligase